MTAEGDLIKLMQEDASFQPEDKMGKIGAVATDIAEIDIEILTMAIAQNAFMLNKRLDNWKLARSKTEVAFLLKKGENCIWCPSDLYNFSKEDIFLDNEFALSMACHLTKGLLLKEIYLFQNDKLSDVLTKNIQKKGLTVKYLME